MAKETKQTDEQVIEVIPFEQFRRRRHGGGSTFGLVVLFVGVLLLFNNLGLVPWDVWNGLGKFWPVVVILIGIKIFAGRTLFARILTNLLLIFVLAGVLAYILYFYGLLSTFVLPHF
jgi:hypothetical protein